MFKSRGFKTFQWLTVSSLLAFVAAAGIVYWKITDLLRLYSVFLVFTFVMMLFLLSQYHQFVKSTQQDLKELVKKESLINGALIMINTEEKLKSVLSLEIEDCSATGTESSVVFFDVDELGFINQKYGYNVGDQSLIEIILATKVFLEPRDHLARIKGDTFAVLLPKRNASSAYAFAEALNEAIQKIDFGLIETLTCRYAVISIHGWITDEKLMNLAYDKLKLAKEHGKGVIL